MNSQSNVMNESFDSHRPSPISMTPTRPLYWSIRRELWEHRSIFIAPLAVAGIILLGFSLSLIAGIWEPALRLNLDKAQQPFDLAAALLMLIGIVVSVFYCLDALHGERRDRSILFWKSLPVSDTTTVLAKASIPLVIVPLLIFTTIVVMQWLMLMVSSAVLLASGQSVAILWTKISIFQMSWLMLYHMLTAHALWPAPVYCWLLLVSGWSRRATFLWAILPLVVIAGLEQIVFHSAHFAAMVAFRLFGATPNGDSNSSNMFPTDAMNHVHLHHFLMSPGLWIGLALAAIFLAAAVQLRRTREPI